MYAQHVQVECIGIYNNNRADFIPQVHAVRQVLRKGANIS